MLLIRLLFALSIILLATPSLKASDARTDAVLESLGKFQEGRELIQAVWKGGPIRVEIMDMNHEMEAIWNSGRRVIEINSKYATDPAHITRYIVFEMHNAKTTAQFVDITQRAYWGWIDVDAYVRENEWLEYKNVLETSKVLKSGIENGLFPPESEWKVKHDFEGHYAIQQKKGHSQYYVVNYPGPRHLSHYRGTL